MTPDDTRAPGALLTAITATVYAAGVTLLALGGLSGVGLWYVVGYFLAGSSADSTLFGRVYVGVAGGGDARHQTGHLGQWREREYRIWQVTTDAALIALAWITVDAWAAAACLLLKWGCVNDTAYHLWLLNLPPWGTNLKRKWWTLQHLLSWPLIRRPLTERAYRWWALAWVPVVVLLATAGLWLT